MHCKHHGITHLPLGSRYGVSLQYEGRKFGGDS